MHAGSGCVDLKRRLGLIKLPALMDRFRPGGPLGELVDFASVPCRAQSLQIEGYCSAVRVSRRITDRSAHRRRKGRCRP